MGDARGTICPPVHFSLSGVALLLRRVRVFLLALVLGVSLGAVAPMLSLDTAASAVSPNGFSAQTDRIQDVDGDRIPDDVEIAVCGTVTCATGLEDRDNDGIPDWTEILSCGDRTCADPKKDRDGDGIPDYAERLVCGSDTCSNSLEDEDGDGIGDWVEFVICGDRTCATGNEDYDGDGISDAVQLAACVKRVDDLAVTGQPWFWLLVAAGAIAVGGGGWLYLRHRRGALPAPAGAEPCGVDEEAGAKA